MIDDDQDLVRSFQVILESKNFEVVTAINGKEGYEKLKNEKPDLLVLDVMMDSELEGYSLLHNIKDSTDFQNLPIILLTGMLDELGVNLAAGVEDIRSLPNVRFENKPIDPLALVEMIESMLQ